MYWYEFSQGYIKAESEDMAKDYLEKIFKNVFDEKLKDFEIAKKGEATGKVNERIEKSLKNNGPETSQYEVRIDTQRGKEGVVVLEIVDVNEFGFQGFKTEKVEI